MRKSARASHFDAAINVDSLLQLLDDLVVEEIPFNKSLIIIIVVNESEHSGILRRRVLGLCANFQICACENTSACIETSLSHVFELTKGYLHSRLHQVQAANLSRVAVSLGRRRTDIRLAVLEDSAVWCALVVPVIVGLAVLDTRRCRVPKPDYELAVLSATSVRDILRDDVALA